MRSCSPRKAQDTELGLSGRGRGVGNSLTLLFSFPTTATSRRFGIKPGNPGEPRARLEPWPGSFSCWEREWAARKIHKCSRGVNAKQSLEKQPGRSRGRISRGHGDRDERDPAVTPAREGRRDTARQGEGT